MIGERAVNRQSYSGVARKRLADVTNSQVRSGLDREARSLKVSAAADDYVNQLFQENAALARVLEERNKVIQLNATELSTLREMNQKMQMQNWGLAQSNSQMLSGLKMGREKMKMLQHELVCREVLRKAKDSEIRRKAEGELAKIAPTEAATDPSDKPDDDAAKRRNQARKWAMKTQSISAINWGNRYVEKETARSERQCERAFGEVRLLRARIHGLQPARSREMILARQAISQGGLESPVAQGSPPQQQQEDEKINLIETGKMLIILNYNKSCKKELL